MQPKLLLQELWNRNVSWDETLPPDILQRWIKWKHSLHTVSDLTIQRWYGTTGCDETIQLHVFADASTQAYCSVAYLRVISTNDVHVNFLLGKSRLTPLKVKAVSIPRLELQAAVTATRIKTAIFNALQT